MMIKIMSCNAQGAEFLHDNDSNSHHLPWVDIWCISSYLCKGNYNWELYKNNCYNFFVSYLVNVYVNYFTVSRFALTFLQVRQIESQNTDSYFKWVHIKNLA